MKKGYKFFIYLVFTFAFFILFFPGKTLAQNYIIKYFDNENGQLPSTISKVILKDRQGYIWVGTNGGLIRYDGYSFKVLRDELHSQYVKDIIQLRDGSFLVVTQMGISRVYNGVDSLHVVSLLKGSEEPTDSTVCYPQDVFQGENGGFWIGEYNAVVHYKNGHLKRFHFHTSELHPYSSRSYIFARDDKGQLLLASGESGQLYYYNPKSDSFHNILLPVKNDPNDNFSISDIIVQPGGWIWLGTSRGVYRFKPIGKGNISDWGLVAKIPSVSCLTKFKKERSFVGTWLDGLYEIKKHDNTFEVKKINIYSNNDINSLALGHDGELWISSDQGFALMYPRFFLPASLPTKSKFITSVALRNDSTVYVTNGFRIYKSQRTGSGYTMKAVSPEAATNKYTSLAFLNNQLVAGTRNGNVLKLTDGRLQPIISLGSGTLQRPIQSMYSYHGDLWICQATRKGATFYQQGRAPVRYGPSKGGNTVFHIFKAGSGGDLIAGSEGQDSYLYSFDKKTDRFVNISARLPESLLKLEHKRLIVNDMTLYQNNDILLATNYGLLQLRLNGFSRAVFNGRLINDYFKSVLIDKNQNIWLGTEKGLYISYRGEVTRIDKSDGLPSLSIVFNGVKLDKNSRLWVGTSYGLAYSKKPIDNLEKAPKPLLLQVFVKNRPYHYKPGNPIMLNTGSRIQLKLTALAYPADKIHFETILADHNSHILYMGSSQKDLLSIPVNKRGKLEIYIVTNQSGYKWSDPLTLNLNVSYPWYARWWAYILYIIGLIIAGYTLIDYRRVKKLRRLEKEKFERQDRVMWQILDVVPHFVYARDSKGRYLLANKALLETYRTNRDEIAGKTDTDIIGIGTEADSIQKSDRLVINTGKPLRIVEEFVSPDGKKMHLQVTKIPLLLPDEELNAVAGVAVDITELVNAQTALKESEQRFKIFADASYEGIVIAEDGKIVDVNKRMCEITGFKSSDIVGKMVWDFVPSDKLESLQEQVSIGFEQPYETELFNVHQSRFPIITRGREFIYKGKKMRMISIRDITNEKKAQNELKEYSRKLEASNKELQDFAYVASHDLQEPLRKIQAFGDLLLSDLGDKLDEDNSFYLERMRSASGRMQKLINGLLSFSRVTTKARPYELTDLNQIVKEVLGDLEIRIQETGAEIVTSDLPKIDADPLQMRQLFQNIIGNALKFIKSDTNPIIKIENKSVTDGVSDALINGLDRCIIEISDNGIGFDQKYADKVFSVFERLHTRSQYEGTGIGLAICRKIVERHGGEISVESKLNVGTTFKIQLPVHQKGKNSK